MSIKHIHTLPYLLLVFLLSFHYSGYAQEGLHDLTIAYNNTSPKSTSRFDLAGKYAQVLFFNNQIDEAFAVLEQNIQDAQKNKDGKYTAYLYCIKAMSYQLVDEKELSKRSIENAVLYSTKTTDISTKAYVKYCEGWLSARNNDDNTATKSLLDALHLYEKAPNTTQNLGRMSAIYNELNTIYANKGAYELQEKYGKKALEVATKLNDPQALFTANMSMGYLYEQRFIQNTELVFLRDWAENHYVKAIQLYKANEDKMVTASNLSFVANNLAHLYFRFYPESYRSQALTYAALAKEIGQKTGQPTHVAAANGLLAELALEQNDVVKAKNYLLTSLNSMQLNSLTDQRIALTLYESLSIIAENEHNYQEALSYYKKYMATFKLIYDQEQLQISKRLEAEFDKERQEQNMVRLQLESEKKQQQIELMHALGLQQTQELEHIRLSEAYQKKQLRLTLLESNKNSQELTISQQYLKLSQLENQNKKDEIERFAKELSYKNKLNTYYIFSILVFFLLLILLLYVLKQRNHHLKQKENLHQLAIEKERQSSKIATLTALLDGQEQERARLARDLHDGLGGLLSGTKIQLTHLNDKINEPIKKDLTKSILHLDSAVDELRRVAHNLMPDLLLKYGLEEALKEYAHRMSHAQLDVDVQFLSYTQSLNSERELLVYRIIQELVNNAIKHAQASQIIIQFVEDDFHYTITVEDDGKGFDVEKTTLSQTAGLHNIQTRIEFLKGNLNIHSDENLGSSFEIQFPKNNT